LRHRGEDRVPAGAWFLLEREFYGMPLDVHVRTQSSRYADRSTSPR
jgi:hypothetical protein